MSDPYQASVVLHLPLTSATGLANTAPNGGLATPVGNAQLSTAQAKWGVKSAVFDGAGDYLSIAHSAALDVGSNDFTIELWAYITSTSQHINLINKRESNNQYCHFSLFVYQTTNQLGVYVSQGSSWLYAYSANNAVPLNQWVHLAMVRYGTNIIGYVNGTAVVTKTGVSGALMTNTSPVIIGGDTNANYMTGYLQDVRITNGVARYTSNFTAPTEPFPVFTPTFAQRLPRYTRDVVDGGPLKIIEPVTRLNAPVRRRVRLCDQRDGRQAREAWSDATTGAVTFDQVREGPWVLYALDHTLEFEAVAISDRLATSDGARP